jgi:hypothetical protein
VKRLLDKWNYAHSKMHGYTNSLQASELNSCHCIMGTNPHPKYFLLQYHHRYLQKEE